MSALNLDINHRVSTAVDAEEVKKYGGFTSLPVRRGNHDSIANTTCEQVLKDWAEIIRDGRDQKCEGAGLTNKTGNGCTLAFCETLPDRIEILTYWTGLMALWDDAAESTNLSDARTHVDLPLHKFFATILNDHDNNNNGAPLTTTTRIPQSPLHRILLPWVRRLLAASPALGADVLRTLCAYYAELDTRPVEDFASMDAYVPYRRHDCDALLWLAFFRYGLDLQLSAAELDGVGAIEEAGMAHMALVNDYWSWPKEKATAARGGRVMNAVVVLQRERPELKGDEEGALRALKEVIGEWERRFERLVAEWVGSGEEKGEAVRRYVDAIALCAGGNMYWASSCPRYNAHRMEEIMAVA